MPAYPDKVQAVRNKITKNFGNGYPSTHPYIISLNLSKKMVNQFKSLNKKEIEIMLRTPILISILIAGADSDIDDAEINKAVETANRQHQKNDKDITHYYHEVAQGFEDKLKIIMQQLPTKTSLRSLQIAKELEKLNDILPKLDPGFAAKFYTSLITMAKNVARASGGLLGYLSIGYEESKLIGLSMIKKPLAVQDS